LGLSRAEHLTWRLANRRERRQWKLAVVLKAGRKLALLFCYILFVEASPRIQGKEIDYSTW
jgi:hypothetical protein